jgi:hypothetical protein
MKDFLPGDHEYRKQFTMFVKESPNRGLSQQEKIVFPNNSLTKDNSIILDRLGWSRYTDAQFEAMIDVVGGISYNNIIGKA